MNNPLHLTAHFHTIWLWGLGWLLTAVCLLAACSGQAAGPQLSYELTQQAYQPVLVSPLALQVQGKDLKFAITFKGGGGSYDEARLERSQNTLRVILFDTDDQLQNMWVLFQLSGSVANLEPGGYVFQVQAENGKLIAEEIFTIRP